MELLLAILHARPHISAFLYETIENEPAITELNCRKSAVTDGENGGNNEAD
jgi:hypothetical protein